MSLGYVLVSGGTDNHLILVNLKESPAAEGLDGARLERILDICNIATNKNTIPTDISAMSPSGIRMGTPALTTRGLTEEDFEKVAELFHRAVKITKIIKNDIYHEYNSNKLKDFKLYTNNNMD